MRCARCGMNNVPGAKACGNCGRQLEPVLYHIAPNDPALAEPGKRTGHVVLAAPRAILARPRQPATHTPAPVGIVGRHWTERILLPAATLFAAGGALFFVAVVILVMAEPFRVVPVAAPRAVGSAAQAQPAAGALPIPVSGEIVSEVSFAEIDREFDRLTGQSLSDYMNMLVGKRVRWTATIGEFRSDGSLPLYIPGKSFHTILMRGIPAEVAQTLRRGDAAEFVAVISRVHDPLGLQVELVYESIVRP